MRRSAAVLMVALVAMLLVATGGSVRATPARLSAGSGQAVAAPHTGRHVAAVVPTSSDQAPQHVDLASTAPDAAAPAPEVVDEQAAGHDRSRLSSDHVTAVGRGPPAL